MTREDIVETLNCPKNGENNRTLLAFCREPKTWGEISQARVRGDKFNTLAELKKSGALLFTDGKYFGTKIALDILDSL